MLHMYMFISLLCFFLEDNVSGRDEISAFFRRPNHLNSHVLRQSIILKGAAYASSNILLEIR